MTRRACPHCGTPAEVPEGIASVECATCGAGPSEGAVMPPAGRGEGDGVGRHVVINPQFYAGMDGTLQRVLDAHGDEGWELSHVVPVTEYQAVLVFRRAGLLVEEVGDE